MPNQAEEDIKETGRVEAFSDGVLAIAITLLILEVRVPHLEEGQSLAEALVNLWPSYLAYFISFTVIGIMWMNHHNLFKYIKRTDNVFLLLNTLLLVAITFVNFPTAVLAEYIQTSQQQAATIFYGIVALAIAVLYNLVWRYASHNNRLLDRNTDPNFVQAINRQYMFGPVFYFVTILLAFVSIWPSLALHVILAVFFALTGSLNSKGQKAG